MKLLRHFVLLTILGMIIALPAPAHGSIKSAIVKIYAVYNEYDYDQPWQMAGQQRLTGSGCVISGKRILTNAHVVADGTFIQVRRAGQAKKYTAEVQIVAHECELAILTVADDSFFAGVEPLKIGDLPEVRDQVSVYGFPTGGDKLSITEGVVSRVEHIEYEHSGANLLNCQIDAAINPGNSGGPVIKNDRIVGVAFEAILGEDVENIGYMVPVPVINHFLEDIADGQYDGFPGLGISHQFMENPDMRRSFGLSEEQTGVLVNKIFPDSAARGFLKTDDIILSIDNENVDNDGTVEFRKGERTSFAYIIQKKFINDTIKLEILRGNKIMSVELKLSSGMDIGRLVPHERHDVAPTYFIIGGLVFEPLTLNYLKTWGLEWFNDAPSHLLTYYDLGEQADDRKEVVMLVKVLEDEINAGYYSEENYSISCVNGKRISRMKDLVKAFEDNDGKYHVIINERGHRIVLDKNKVAKESREVLERYKIGSDRSKDLEG